MNLTNNRLRYVQSGLYFLSTALMGWILATRGAVMPQLSALTGASLSQTGLVITISSLGFMVGNLFGGRLYDKFKGHLILGISLLATALVLSLIPFMQSLVAILVIFFFWGVTRSLVILGASTLTIWLYVEKPGPALNLTQFFFGVGAFTAPLLVGGLLSVTNGFNWIWWLSALAFIALTPLVFLIESPSIRQITPANPQAIAPRTLNEFRRLIFLIALFLFFYVGAEIGFGTWLTTYAQVRLPLEQLSRSYQLTSAFWIAIMVGRLISIPLSARFAARRLLWFLVGGCFLSLLLILIGGSSWVMLLIGSFLLGISMAPIFPLSFAMAEELLEVNGAISSMLFIGASTGALIFPLILGRLLEFTDPSNIIFALMALVLMAAFSYFLLNLAIPRHRTKIQG
jgi:MFS transporter, FHS family, Na+ dependent glucose transporter 1